MPLEGSLSNLAASLCPQRSSGSGRKRMPAAAVAASDLSAGEEVELRNELVHPG
jgi:hypothetical protein